ncbi:MAG: extracellular solute-binding protein [Candidatus Spechtbacterales bacterium]|nr:extracellular solute-binding protein [Candidatus Spechtbacterales bacterium]
MDQIKDPLAKIKDIPPYKKNRVIFGSIAGIFLLVLVVGLVMNILSDDGPGPLAPRITLTIWDPLDNEDAYREIIQNYKRLNPNITIEYESKRIEEKGVSIGESYRDLITEALASGEGPDIYLIGNNWLSIEKSRLTPLNPEPQTNRRTTTPPEGTGINPAAIMGEFPDVVRFDFTREEGGDTRIYALPMFLDSLALYYNEDYFNTHNILQPPATWEEFVDYSKQIRILGEGNEVKLAGAALGAADTHGVIQGNDNVNNAADIVSLLMLQAGAQMNDQFGRVTFDNPVQKDNKKFFPSRDAFAFYTSFADPASENYTWDPEGFFNVDAFANGTAAMMLNYENQRSTIRDKNPNLNFSIGSAPQPADRFDKVNYANYWGMAVAKVSEHPEVAWDFIRFATSEERAKLYLQKTERPPALESLIDDFQDDPELRIFANQILTAKSWRQPNPFETENILNNSIKDALAGDGLSSVVSNAQNKINSLGITR